MVVTSTWTTHFSPTGVLTLAFSKIMTLIFQLSKCFYENGRLFAWLIIWHIFTKLQRWKNYLGISFKMVLSASRLGNSSFLLSRITIRTSCLLQSRWSTLLQSGKFQKPFIIGFPSHPNSEPLWKLKEFFFVLQFYFSNGLVVGTRLGPICSWIRLLSPNQMGTFIIHLEPHRKT